MVGVCAQQRSSCGAAASPLIGMVTVGLFGSSLLKVSVALSSTLPVGIGVGSTGAKVTGEDLVLPAGTVSWFVAAGATL